MVISSATAVPEALRLLQQAIERDPRYGPALALAAVCHLRFVMDSGDDPHEDSHRSVELARRALQLATDDPGTLANAAYALAYFGEDIGAMMALMDARWRLIRALRVAGTSAGRSGVGRGSLIPR